MLTISLAVLPVTGILKGLALSLLGGGRKSSIRSLWLHGRCVVGDGIERTDAEFLSCGESNIVQA